MWSWAAVNQAFSSIFGLVWWYSRFWSKRHTSRSCVPFFILFFNFFSFFQCFRSILLFILSSKGALPKQQETNKRSLEMKLYMPHCSLYFSFCWTSSCVFNCTIVNFNFSQKKVIKQRNANNWLFFFSPPLFRKWLESRLDAVTSVLH